MLRIKTPATTSNLGVGFDCLGLSLNIYNVFEFSDSKEFELFGFAKEYVENNLVLKVYKTLCSTYKITNPKPIKISLVENNIPVARGLGSSASCIIAGALAANHFNDLKLDLEEIAKFSAEYEGHPDNAYACLYGGLVSILKEDNTYIFDTFEISNELKFSLMIPNVLGKTETLRNILPKQINLDDAVYNLSRMIHLPKAFSNGDYELLKTLLKDKYHEKYRASFIPRFCDIKSLANAYNIIQLISGSGPTLFMISKLNNFQKLSRFKEYEIVPVSIANGIRLEVI